MEEDFDDLDIVDSDIYHQDNANLNNKNMDILNSVFIEKIEETPKEEVQKTVLYSKQTQLKKDMSSLVEDEPREIQTKDIITEQNKNYKIPDSLVEDYNLGKEDDLIEKNDFEEKIQESEKVKDPMVEELEMLENKKRIVIEEEHPSFIKHVSQGKEDVVTGINEQFKIMTEEEYMTAFNNSEIVELNNLEGEINQRDTKNRQYIDIKNGEVIYSREDNPSVKMINSVKNNLEKTKEQSKKSGKNLVTFYNRIVDDSVIRNRVLFLILMLFLIIFIAMFISLSKEPKVKEVVMNETITTTVGNKHNEELVFPKNETVISEAISSSKRDIQELNTIYLSQLYNINENDIVSCLDNINKKMNRLSLTNRLENNLTKKENNFSVIEQNKEIFQTNLEIEVYKEIFEKTKESILLSNTLIELVDEGINKEKLNGVIQQFNILNK